MKVLGIISMENPNDSSVLTDKELRVLIKSLVTSAGTDGITEDELLKAVNLVSDILTSYTLVNMLFKGLIEVKYNKVLHDLDFQISPKGKAIFNQKETQDRHTVVEDLFKKFNLKVKQDPEHE